MALSSISLMFMDILYLNKLNYIMFQRKYAHRCASIALFSLEIVEYVIFAMSSIKYPKGDTDVISDNVRKYVHMLSELQSIRLEILFGRNIQFGISYFVNQFWAIELL